MGQGIEKRAKFDIIRYSNCWEDADILLQALALKEGDICLSIASSGDNTFSLLKHNPSLVLAVDISVAQLACVELRKVAFLNLSYEDTLKFLGIYEGLDRITTYKKIRNNLSEFAQEFWDANQELIIRGIIHVGKFEKFFQLFRNRILPLIHGKRKVFELLKEKDESTRVDFYDKEWNTWRWRILFKVFFSRTVLGRLGRDPEFFKYVEGDVANRIMERTKYALTVLPTDKNPYLEYILTGNFQNMLPFYLRKSNFEIIRKNLDKLVIFEGNIDEALQAHSTLRFNKFNLSDIFEYMSHEEYVDELNRIVSSSQKGGRLVYWNMLADRRAPENFGSRLKFLGTLAQKLFLQDKAFFYKTLIIEEII